MKRIVLGTAGHIDHGKTSLIKALTGVNTDRLKEEQLRGITIELGFAALDLPSGLRIGIVDVPGHERFVKNMVAGATGIDIVVLVIAADEGVMPQTREHMEICTLLGVRHGFVALTKIDMVDEEMRELAQEDVKDYLAGSFLEQAPIVPVSAVTGQGIDVFIQTLDHLAAEVPSREPAGLFRLPVDRVFTMKGFGTVITGTLSSGRVRVGDAVMLYPSGLTSKVRGIQVHNAAVEEALVGQRTAINLQGLEKSAVERGEVISTPGALESGYMVDVALLYLPSNKKTLKNRTRVRFHTGTSEVLGLLVLLDRDEIEPGDQAPVQLRLDTPVALVKDDRYVLRSYSPVRTIGGGKVLNPIPPKHKRGRPEVGTALAALDGGTPEIVVGQHLSSAAFQGVSFKHLRLMTNLTDKALDNVLQQLMTRRAALLIDRDQQVFIHGDSFEALKRKCQAALEKYHRANPLKAGMPKEELKSKFPRGASAKLFTLVLNQMAKENTVAMEEEAVRLAAHRVSLAADQTELQRRFFDAYRAGGLQPPYFKELSKEAGVAPDQCKDVLQLLVNAGQLVKVKEDLYFDRQAIETLKDQLVAFLRDSGEITTPQFKDMTGVSRKYLIPLAEYFDTQSVTIRVGEVRKLRRSG